MYKVYSYNMRKTFQTWQGGKWKSRLWIRQQGSSGARLFRSACLQLARAGLLWYKACPRVWTWLDSRNSAFQTQSEKVKKNK